MFQVKMLAWRLFTQVAHKVPDIRIVTVFQVGLYKRVHRAFQNVVLTSKSLIDFILPSSTEVSKIKILVVATFHATSSHELSHWWKKCYKLHKEVFCRGVALTPEWNRLPFIDSWLLALCFYNDCCCLSLVNYWTYLSRKVETNPWFWWKIWLWKARFLSFWVLQIYTHENTRMKGTTITSSISYIYFCGSASNKSLMEQRLFLSIARWTISRTFSQAQKLGPLLSNCASD